MRQRRITEVGSESIDVGNSIIGLAVFCLFARDNELRRLDNADGLLWFVAKAGTLVASCLTLMGIGYILTNMGTKRDDH